MTTILSSLTFMPVEDVSLGWTKATHIFPNSHQVTVMKNAGQGLYAVLLSNEAANAINCNEDVLAGLTDVEAEAILEEVESA